MYERFSKVCQFICYKVKSCFHFTVTTCLLLVRLVQQINWPIQSFWGIWEHYRVGRWASPHSCSGDKGVLQKFIIILSLQVMRPINLKRNQFQHGLNRQLPHSASSAQLKPDPYSFPRKTYKTQITVAANQLGHQLKHYEWRYKTEFPIVKVVEYYIKQSSQTQTVFQVNHQECLLRLQQLKDLPLFKLLFLIKESIIGFERLFDRFGGFKITANMVAINYAYKCKVWLNQNFSSNSYTRSSAAEKQFLSEIFELFEQRSNSLKNTALFFNDLKQFSTFCQALSFIENYARQNRISIPTICRISQNEKATVQSESPIRTTFDPNLTMGRAPKFLNGSLRSTLKMDSNSMFKDVMQRYSQKVIFMESGQKNPQMKASGDTANSMQEVQNTRKIENQLIQSVVFDDKGKETKTKSFLPASNVEKTNVFSRKLSNQEEIHCHTPAYQKKIWEEECHHVGLDWNDTAFLNDEQEQEDNLTNSIHTNSVFNKNNWEQTLNGLLQDESTLKKSIHEGKQLRNLEMSTRNLKLLQGFGKTLHQSCIHGE